MKRLLISIALLIFAVSGYSQESRSFTLQTTLTNVAAFTTNSTAAPAYYLYDAQSPVRIYLTGTGNAGTTNGVASGVFTVYFSTASGNGGQTNAFDTANLSNIKLSITNAWGANTITVSDWFVVEGARYLRVGRIENSFAGSVSNVGVGVGYKFGK